MARVVKINYGNELRNLEPHNCIIRFLPRANAFLTLTSYHISIRSLSSKHIGIRAGYYVTLTVATVQHTKPTFFILFYFV